ncbi:hypothetical protein D4764_20G0008010 [Takifugu flavidus]|uniref:Uncharacterized protein n=1 Tax=Takifugu flavidus TaxID=433684 RepID=A0A5C6NJI0_9TELE|nr:hypothetical protein D4764_20G0008010 [Takifugu flavidus]
MGIVPLNKRELLPPGRKLWRPQGDQPGTDQNSTYLLKCSRKFRWTREAQYLYLRRLSSHSCSAITMNNYIDTSVQKGGIPGVPGCLEHNGVVTQLITAHLLYLPFTLLLLSFTPLLSSPLLPILSSTCPPPSPLSLPSRPSAGGSPYMSLVLLKVSSC